MSVIPSSRGNAQLSEIAVQDALAFLGSLSREDAQTVMDLVNADMARLYEDRNVLLTQGGTVTFTGTEVQFTEALQLEINSQVAGGAPTLIDLGSATRSVAANGDMIYAVVDRSLGTAVVTDAAATLPAVASPDKEVFLIAKRVDTGAALKRLYFRNGMALDEGQSASLGASGSGSGSGNSDISTLQDQLVISSYMLLTAIAFESDADSNVDGASTGEYSLASKRFVQDAAGETLITTNLLDAEEFLDEGKDITELDLSLTYDLANIDDSPTVEVSRDGGNEYQTVSMSRIGETDTYSGSHTFTAEAANQLLEQNATPTGSQELDDSGNLTYEQSFVASAAEIVRNVDLGLQVNGSPTGLLRVAIHENDGGSPGAVLAQSAGTDISTLSTGSVAVSVPNTALISGETYHIVVSTDAEYKAGFVTSTTSIEVDTNGSGLIYDIDGRELDLRLRVISSDPTGDNAENEFRIRTYGVFYDREFGQASGVKKLDRRDFTAADNLNQFTINFVPDPDLLKVYYVQTGQVFSYPAFGISDRTITFPVDTFDNGGDPADITLIFAEFEGSVFDNSDQNANAIAKHADQIDAVGTKTAQQDMADADLISVPHTDIVGRAPIRDLSKIPAPKMGIERIHARKIKELSNESVSSGARVYTLSSDEDHLDRIRLVGNVFDIDNSSGVRVAVPEVGDYIEVTFYGTGLNMLVAFIDGSDRGFDVDVDGVAGTPVVMTGASLLSGRNYDANYIFPIVSGLAEGIHTVKLTKNSAPDSNFSGFEILNENTSIEISSGSAVIAKGDRHLIPSNSSLGYSVQGDFDSASDTLGTKGGAVVVYSERQSDSSIQVKQRFNATDASQLNLTSADHSNEEVVQRLNWRRFGAGRADDFSTELGASGVSRAFTLDDGTTTLVGDDVRDDHPNGALRHNVNGADIILTFVGTGLDIIRQDNTSGGSDTYTVYVDGSSIGTLDSTGSTERRIEKIVSGLPYGTHVVRIERTAVATFVIGVHDFLIYAPKKPSIPDGAGQLGSYYKLADYSQAGIGVEAVSPGIVRKQNIREMIYSGSWTATVVQASRFSGFGVSTSTNSDYVEYTFFGDGIDFRYNGEASTTLTISIDGSTDLSSYTTSTVGQTLTPGTGEVSGPDTGTGTSVSIRDLGLGLHTIRVTGTSLGLFVFDSFDVITPVYSYDSSEQLLHDRLVGSNSIRSETGLPNFHKEKQHFPQGVDLGASKTKWQVKPLTADANTIAEIEDWKFYNLEIGKTYKITVMARGVWTGGDESTLNISVNNGNTLVQEMTMLINNNSGTSSEAFTISRIFTATDSTLICDLINASGTKFIQGISGGTRSYAMLEELPNHIETDQWAKQS